MFFNLRFTACCLVLLGTSLTYAQNVRVVVNFRGDVTIFGTANDDRIRVSSLQAFNTAFGAQIEGDPDALYVWQFLADGVAQTTFEFEGEEFEFFVLPRTSSSSIVYVDSGGGDDVFALDADVNTVWANLGRGRDAMFVTGSVESDLIVDSGSEQDQVEFKNVPVGRNVWVNLGTGEAIDEDDLVEIFTTEDLDQTHFDAVELSTVDIGGSLTVNQTTGAGFCVINDVEAGSTRVTLGTGHDVCDTLNSTLGSVYMDVGPGIAITNEELVGKDNSLQRARLRDTQVNGSLTLVGSSSNDGLTGEAVVVNGNLNIYGGDGDDVCGLGVGFGMTRLRSTVTGNVVISTAAGDDQVFLEGEVFGNVWIDTSFDNDELSIDCNAPGGGYWIVNTGNGDDELNLGGDLSVLLFYANLGSGMDDVDENPSSPLEIRTAFGDPQVDGGPGFDCYFAAGNSPAATLFSFDPCLPRN